MNLRASFTFSLVFVVWVAACVFAFTTHEKRPCLVKYPGSGTGDCAQTSCHEFLDPDLSRVYFVKSYGKQYKKCGSSEYYLNCEEKAPSNPVCAVWYRYDTHDDCVSALGDNSENLGGAWHQAHSDKPSCQEYSW